MEKNITEAKQPNRSSTVEEIAGGLENDLRTAESAEGRIQNEPYISPSTPRLLPEQQLVKAIRNLDPPSETDTDYSLAESDGSIFEPIEKRLAKVHSKKTINPISKDDIKQGCPIDQLETVIYNLVDQDIKNNAQERTALALTNKTHSINERMKKSNSKYRLITARQR